MHERLTAPQPDPLIELPGAEPAAVRRPRPARAVPSQRARSADEQQLSLFGVEAAPPAPEDLEGLLAGPGQVVRMGGTARVSVIVEEVWRARVLAREFALRGLTTSCVPSADEHIGVRTAYSTRLAALAGAWLRGAAVKVPPPDFGLDGRRLRLWAIAAGQYDPLGFTLRLGTSDEPAWAAVGAALTSLGLPATLLGPRAGGPGYRISGRRRLYRLAELVGDTPAGTPPETWPTRHSGGSEETDTVTRDVSHG